MRFEDLEIIEPILQAVREEGYTKPTAIQERAIPMVLAGEDVLGSAQTGTGKTAAFSIPIIQHLHLGKKGDQRQSKIQGLIVTPTRELAIQIGESLSTYGRHTRIRNTVIFGGVNQSKQIDALKKGVDILVATPGRLLDLMNQGFISLNDIRYFVLDEADRMLDMGFIHDIKKIIAKLPSRRQSLFFSATMPDNILDLSRKILNHPKKVEVNPVSSTAATINQFLYYTNKSTKKNLLLHVLEDQEMDQVLIFAKTKHGSDRVNRYLRDEKIKSAAIHGDKSQNQRQKALQQFKDGQIRVLVATDIAARGIDIDDLQYVINYDIPNIAETYVHRIGRSGRAGAAGVAISISEPEENAFIRDIEKLIKKKIEVIEKNPFPQTDKPMSAAERKEFEKEKNRRRQEFFANRKKKKSGPGGERGRNKRK
ncbi:DEAD/DEAH box helicase [Algoriphagus sediminis]|uniref:DEAD/DEAH box helicase n=1 Tax=Algoriphagus sediminis TaxID=3057113 RepID=A0ABT7YEP3_9BACT|nr:DEAD/DEAH box helicase [Algoriphagus sediminis]MDN3204972.1 DEAD/DEAH box helicase [Algoriphagus sediminis]